MNTSSKTTTVRVLATEANVTSLFEETSLVYEYRDSEGKTNSCLMPGWKCRQCGWESLYGMNRLPFPHEHQTGADTYGVAGSVSKF